MHLEVSSAKSWRPFFSCQSMLKYPDSKIHGAYMGPTWGRQDPGGPHVGPRNLIIRVIAWCHHHHHHHHHHHIVHCNHYARLKHPFYVQLRKWKSLQWRHNERNGISNQQRLGCSLNHLFRRASKKPSNFRVTGLCEGNPPVTGGSPPPPHKGPVMRKMFPFHDWSEKKKQIIGSDFCSVWAMWRGSSGPGIPTCEPEWKPFSKT